MAKEESKPAAGGADSTAGRQGINVQLVPSTESERPVFANFTTLHPAPGTALLDFGFLEPAALAALTQMARSGKKMPERLNGRLSARVALPYDALATLHQQIGRLLQAVAKQRKEQQ